MESHSASQLVVLITTILLVSFTSAESTLPDDTYCFQTSLSSQTSLSMTSKCGDIRIKLTPSEHILDTELTVKDALNVEMQASSGNFTTIICRGSKTITFESISRVHVKDVVFIGCTGIRIAQVEQVIIENCRFRGPGESVADSAVTLFEVSSAQITDTIFTSYDNVKNGALSTYFSRNVFILRSTFQKNAAIKTGGEYREEGNGGCIYSNNSIVLISSSTFIDNTAEGWGGGCIFASYSDVGINASKFINNTALNDQGGALYVTYTTLRIGDCNFNANNALKGRGGALHAYYYNDVTISKCIFRGNTAGWGYAGGLYAYGHNNFFITDSTFIENTAIAGGSIYIHYYINVFIKDSTFVRNEATRFDGGAIYFQNQYNATLVGCVLRDNKAQQDGGGVYVYDSVNLIVYNCVFRGNIAARNGGGQGSAKGNIMRITESVFNNNTAWWGNGRCIYSETDSELDIDEATRKSISNDPGCLSET